MPARGERGMMGRFDYEDALKRRELRWALQVRRQREDEFTHRRQGAGERAGLARSLAARASSLVGSNAPAQRLRCELPIPSLPATEWRPFAALRKRGAPAPPASTRRGAPRSVPLDCLGCLASFGQRQIQHMAAHRRRQIGARLHVRRPASRAASHGADSREHTASRPSIVAASSSSSVGVGPDLLAQVLLTEISRASQILLGKSGESLQNAKRMAAAKRAGTGKDPRPAARRLHAPSDARCCLRCTDSGARKHWLGDAAAKPGSAHVAGFAGPSYPTIVGRAGPRVYPRLADL
ncbi:hypothetical protein PHYSODRAFT_306444 [Phytophthora sojae]|uniref:Uncharacterized protein n=1 Tax=Phytophthora sojae (strain P6497) TaxID=1094619 RepID=G5AB62_PHYSP|nr:hypothetical protein PHYSODRAFT_306444 [Phytophthora sojae]EGZ07207.1 hypothetical protein PHYSODRAFT_306444 [Phytophthora sojae]|eukprot:XP_009536773.1 hypothetical protein PHYSODRAFT_306444 [Phytophthora sojae]